jgi:hypothetical protein
VWLVYFLIISRLKDEFQISTKFLLILNTVLILIHLINPDEIQAIFENLKTFKLSSEKVSDLVFYQSRPSGIFPSPAYLTKFLIFAIILFFLQKKEENRFFKSVLLFSCILSGSTALHLICLCWSILMVLIKDWGLLIILIICFLLYYLIFQNHFSNTINIEDFETSFSSRFNFNELLINPSGIFFVILLIFSLFAYYLNKKSFQKLKLKVLFIIYLCLIPIFIQRDILSFYYAMMLSVLLKTFIDSKTTKTSWT